MTIPWKALEELSDAKNIILSGEVYISRIQFMVPRSQGGVIQNSNFTILALNLSRHYQGCVTRHPPVLPGTHEKNKAKTGTQKKHI
jgi:ubiquitin C-terminal hydrolase